MQEDFALLGRGKQELLTECQPLQADVAKWRGEEVVTAKRQDITAGVLIPTEIYGLILCSFNRPSSLMKVRQTRRTAMIKNTSLDKEVKPLTASEALSPALCCARRSSAGESDHLKEQS